MKSDRAIVNKTDTENKEVQYGSWEISGPTHYFREKMLIKNLKKSVSEGKVLDVGCGTGSLLLKLALLGYKVYGIDLSEQCVNISSKRLKDLLEDDESKTLVSSATNIDYPDKLFDVIIAAEVLEHLDEDADAVAEFYRLLRPGGLCFITVPNNPGLWSVSDELAGHKRRYRKIELVKLFENQKFQVENIFTWGFPLMRLYQKLVFIRWAKRIDKKFNAQISNDDIITKIGLNKWVSITSGNLFRIDNLFTALPWGTGIMLIARKNSSIDR